MKQNQKKSNKGITLVALVITIILLLILAGISIATLTGSGLFEKAKLAKEQSEERQKEEEQTLGEYTNKINEYVNGTRNINNISYSLQEQDTELTWIDGKKIYQKSFDCGYFPATANEFKLIPVEVDNIDSIIDLKGMIYGPETSWWAPFPNPGGFYDHQYMCIDYHDGNLRLYSGENRSNQKAYATIWYTKTEN